MQPGAEPQGPVAEAGQEVSAPLAEDAGEPAQGPAGVRARASGWATAAPYRLPVGVAVVGLVVSAPFGGWRAAEPEALPAVAVQDMVEAAPFELELERAYHTPLPSDSFPALDPGEQYVVLLGTVTSRHDTSVTGTLLSLAVEVTDLPDALDGGGQPLEEGTAVSGVLYSGQDSTQLRQIGPDLPFDFGLVFASAAEEFPDELTVEISGYTWRADGFSQVGGWHDPEAVARVTVPLAVREGEG